MNDVIKITLVFAVLAALVPALVFIGRDKPEGSQVSAVPASGRTVRVLSESTGKTADYDETEFIALSLMAQIPESYENEAIKAQAVLIRTYLERRRRAEKESPTKELKGALVSDNRQKYQSFFTKAQAKKYFGKDFENVFSRLCRLTADTKTEVLLYDGEPVLPAYHAVSCGVTRSAKDAWGQDIPYLVSVKSPQDNKSPDYEAVITLTVGELQKRLEKAFPDIDFSKAEKKTLTELETDKNGIISKALVCGNEVSSGELCAALGLSSPCAEVKYKSGKFTFTTHGLGHLVGLSLYGANSMAHDGKDHRDILEYYFKGAKVEQKAP